MHAAAARKSIASSKFIPAIFNNNFVAARAHHTAITSGSFSQTLVCNDHARFYSYWRYRNEFLQIYSNKACKQLHTSACRRKQPSPATESSSVTTSAVDASSSKTAAASEKPLITTETIGQVRMIGLNRPEKRNCMNSALAQALRDTLRAFEQDDSVKAGVLFGEGGTFCAGYDLSEASSYTLEDIRQAFREEEGLLGPTRWHMCKKPLVAGISGYAVAGGFELALFCDIRIADDNAVLGVFNRRFGVPLIDGGTVRLPRLIGLSRALDIIMTGRAVSAKEAHDIGLLYNVCAPGCAVGQAYQLAVMLAKFPQQGLLGDRQSAYNAAYNCATANSDSGSAALHEAEEFQRAIRYEQKVGYAAAQEALQGATAFAQKGLGKHGKFNFDYAKIVSETSSAAAVVGDGSNASKSKKET